jgi:hypothetical protein
MLPVDYPSKGHETRIMKAVLASADEKQIKDVLTLAHETRQRSLAYSLSTRDVVQVLEDAQRCGMESALRLASGKFEGQDRDFFKTRIQSIFGASI